MAVYFLAKSPSYKVKTDPVIYRRREVVAKALADDYLTGEETDADLFKAVVKKLAAKKIGISWSTYQADKRLLRFAYLWLQAGSAKKRAAIFERCSSPIEKVGINHLTRDSLFTWSDLQLEGTPRTGRASAVDAPKPARGMLDQFNELSAHFETVLAENEKLKAENQGLEATLQKLRKTLAESEDYSKLADDEISRLEDELRATRDVVQQEHGKSIEEIAELYPNFPALTIIAQEIKDTPGLRRKQLEQLESCLPKTFVWENDSGSIGYQVKFLKCLADLRQDEQTQVIEQLELLSTQGMEYASLHTRKTWGKMPNSPSECLVSRGADDLRFTWKKDGAITVYWLYRKGASRVRQSE